MKEIIFSENNSVYFTYDINWSNIGCARYLFFDHDIPFLNGVNIFISYVDENLNLIKGNIDLIQVPYLTRQFTIHFEYDTNDNVLQNDISRTFEIDVLYELCNGEIFSEPASLDTYNLKIKGRPRDLICNPPENIKTSFNLNNLIVSWDDAPNSSFYIIKIIRLSNSEESTYQSSQTTIEIPLSEIGYNSTYNVIVETNCGRGDISQSSVPIEIITPLASNIDSFAVPQFENLQVGTIKNEITIQFSNDNRVEDPLYYTIEWKFEEDELWGDSRNVRNFTSSFNNLEWGRKYNFRLKASYPEGESNYSDIFSYTVPENDENIPSIICDSVKYIDYVIEDGFIKLSWDDKERTIPSSNYIIEYREADKVNWTTITTSNKHIDILIGDENKNYEIKITTKCGSTSSIESSIVVINSGLNICYEPKKIELNPINTTSIRVTWDVLMSSNMIVQSYTLYYRIEGMKWKIINDIQGTTYVLNNLTPNTIYEIFLTTACFDKDNAININSLNSSIWKTRTLWTTPDCKEVNNVSYDIINPNTVNLKWDEPNTLSVPFNYTIFYKPIQNRNYQREETSINEITITGLLAGTRYEFQIVSNCTLANNDALSSPSVKLELETDSNRDIQCPTVNQLNIDSQTPTSISLRWDYPDYPFNNFEIEILNQFNTNTELIKTRSKQITIRDLHPNSLYQFRIRTVCPFGESTWSGFTEIRTMRSQCLPPESISIFPADDSLRCFDYFINPQPGSARSFGYEIEYNYSSGLTRRIETNEISGRICPENSRTGDTVRFRAKLICENGISAWSPYSSPFDILSCPKVETIIIEYNEDALVRWNMLLGASEYTLRYSPIFPNSDPNALTSQAITAIQNDNFYEASLSLQGNVYLSKIITDCETSENESSYFLLGRQVLNNKPSYYSVENTKINRFEIKWIRESNATHSYLKLGYESNGVIQWDNWIKFPWNRSQRTYIAERDTFYSNLHVQIYQVTENNFYKIYQSKNVNQV